MIYRFTSVEANPPSIKKSPDEEYEPTLEEKNDAAPSFATPPPTKTME